MNSVDVFECVGSLSALSGALLLSLKFRYSKYGWIGYMVANVFLLAFALDISRFWLSMQYMGFTLTSLIGVWNWVVVDRYPSLPLIDLNLFKSLASRTAGSSMS